MLSNPVIFRCKERYVLISILQLIDAGGNDEDSNDSSDGHNGSRRRGNAGRVNYNVKDMISNNMHSLVHDSEGRLVSVGGYTGTKSLARDRKLIPDGSTLLVLTVSWSRKHSIENDIMCIRSTATGWTCATASNPPVPDATVRVSNASLQSVASSVGRDENGCTSIFW